MPHYRYRAETWTGPWRTTRLEAETDAVAAGHAVVDWRRPGLIVWRVQGEIETRDEASAPR
ncbi:hypothetical protein [Sphingosinicella sp. CPCC 101087]|uniref:hypothetical protein n=1 Tax=Sphingosinicella sp. CPCC 101087 TaxID=2497754 RepID=UPI00101E077D|nr:hypothetical protein [Sphingosinicella sp. CPCC 101087]